MEGVEIENRRRTRRGPIGSLRMLARRRMCLEAKGKRSVRMRVGSQAASCESTVRSRYNDHYNDYNKVM